ncbi:hypothetical protein [Paenibacillus odorifer]|uniref:hypothetical protein n=1 Tax=Paenibacillus odorifer TaxID=189426 RepID=UPI00096D29B0|nr:hypothetical protein [Paenibacillus odorifer]OMD07753.1 hypothetical protein BJP47_30280 [Paenibacillus odorifer]
MPSHGWHMTQRREVSSKPCKCGQGFVIDYEEDWESDWSATDRVEYEVEVKCPNKECLSK